jgi:putative ABC transport system permease protein
MHNLKIAFRTLFKSPFITAVAIVSLALGIGANAAIFSLFNQMLLQSLPVPAPEQLVNLGAPGPKPGSTSCNNAGDCDQVFSYRMFKDLERVQQVFTGLAAHVTFGANLSYKGQTQNGEGMLVSGSYFNVLGLTPALGRLFTPDDDKNIGNHFVTVLSHRYWTTKFNQDPNVLNDTIIVDGQSMTIVGVAPARFDGTTLGTRPQVFVPLTMRSLMQPGFTAWENRRNYWAYLFARLKPGVTLEQAKAALNGQYHAIINDVEAPLQTGMSDQTMARFRNKQITMEEGYRGQSSVHEEAATPLAMLLGVTAFVLLIACANIANLLLARGAGRAAEMAVRLSIGANRRQLVTQLLTESLLLAFLGAVAGLLVARWTLVGIGSMLPAEAMQTIDMSIQPAAIIFSAALALGTGLLFGFFPAVYSTRPDLVSTLKSQAGQPSGAKAAKRFRASLATIQVALSMMLLVCAGLFIKSLYNVSKVDLGLKLDNVITFRVSPELNGYKSEQTVAFFERVEDALKALPGVSGVTAGTVPLLAGSNWGNSVRVQGFEAGPDTDTGSRFNQIAPVYFRTLGVPLISGREFTRADAKPNPKVAIVNEAFAKKFNLGRDAVGKRMGQNEGKELDIEIIGLVQNAKYSEVKAAIPPQFFIPYRQAERMGRITFYVRTSLDAEQLLSTIQPVIAKLDPNLPIEELRTMPQQIRENVFLERIMSTLSASFAALATLLAAIGLYGVLAYTIAQRTREIGLRMALGANRGTVRGMVLRQVSWMTVIGGVVGLAGAVGLGRAAKSLLFELEGYDPTVLIASATLLTLVALGAGFVPAQRASQIDPMRALRYE